MKSSRRAVGIRSRVGVQHKISRFFVARGERKQRSVKQGSKEDDWRCDQRVSFNTAEADRHAACETRRKKRTGIESPIDALFKGTKKNCACVVPCCTVHQLPCVRHQVTKEGKNKGRFFYVCQLPVGFKGDPKAKCNFFQWEDSFTVC